MNYDKQGRYIFQPGDIVQILRTYKATLLWVPPEGAYAGRNMLSQPEGLAGAWPLGNSWFKTQPTELANIVRIHNRNNLGYWVNVKDVVLVTPFSSSFRDRIRAFVLHNIELDIETLDAGYEENSKKVSPRYPNF